MKVRNCTIGKDTASQERTIRKKKKKEQLTPTETIVRSGGRKGEEAFIHGIKGATPVRYRQGYHG